MSYSEKLSMYTLYSFNLTDPHKSFDSNITLSDFTRKIDYLNMKDAKTIKYINPRGTSIVLKDKHGVKDATS